MKAVYGINRGTSSGKVSAEDDEEKGFRTSISSHFMSDKLKNLFSYVSIHCFKTNVITTRRKQYDCFN